MTINGEVRVDLPAPGGQRHTLYESDRTRVTRLPPAGGVGSVICKEPLGPDADRRLRHELAILDRLVGVAGMPQLAPVPPRPGAILMEDVGGSSLTSIGMPLEVGRLITLARELADVVAAMHRAGVVHRDISPANIVISPAAPLPLLIDFELATTFVDERPGFAHQSEIEGTLPYLAPEQTGRTGRPVDQRADLYALGATLYELATGRPPFGSGDPLRLTHDHLARVPTPPDELNAAISLYLSRVILHLLEKEPDHRYQSAEGLAYDLSRLREAPSGAGPAPLPLGERDFPLRLLPPSRLIGREPEIAQLSRALDRALAGEGRGLLVSGASGVGKSALTDELRPMVAAAGGWFVRGKFDRFRRDQDYDGLRQAFRALGRLLLAEPEEEVVRLRGRLLASLGSRAEVVASVLPEFAVLLRLGGAPVPGDPLNAQVRMEQLGPDLLRVIASPRRPIVLVVDDLQWSGPTPLGTFDAMLTGEDLRGVLVVGAYRSDEIDSTQPLAGMLARWDRLGVTPDRIDLHNLPRVGLATLLADMLRLNPAEAASLADAVAPRTDGNPFDTVELINALRRDGALTPGPEGWQWDARTLHRYLGRADVADLLMERIDGMPPRTRSLLEVMACLGGQVDLAVLRIAADLPRGALVDELDDELAPALDDGLLIHQPGDAGSVRFRHDRVQEAVLRRLTADQRRALRLALARRLDAASSFGGADQRRQSGVVAAEAYLGVTDTVGSLAERRHVAEIFREAAAHARLVSNHTMVERFLTASLELVEPPDIATLVTMETDRQTALYSLGRLDEADEAYKSVKLCADPLGRTDATCVQISSFTNRGRLQDALALGLELLGDLGYPIPPMSTLDDEVERGLPELYLWANDSDENSHNQADLRRPEIDDPRVLAITKVINRMLVPAFLANQLIMAWLVEQAARLWAEYGPAAALVGALSHIPFVTIGRRGDYRTGYRGVRRILAASEAHGYEPETSQARMLYTLGTGPWFEPLEDNVHHARLAQEGLIQGGDLQNAGYAFVVTTVQPFDYAPSLEAFLVEVDSAIAFAARLGNEQVADLFLGYQAMAGKLRGDPQARARFDESLSAREGDPISVANLHLARVTDAMISGDAARLERHAELLRPVLPLLVASYTATPMTLALALSLANRARAAPADERKALLTDLDRFRDWLAARAEDAPGNFRHLVQLVDAERAWAIGDFRGAATAYDAAQREVAARQRPWHRALITERAARFHLEFGLEFAGHGLLREARRAYELWGAGAMVQRLDDEFPLLRPDRTPMSTRDGSVGDADDMDTATGLTPRSTSITTGAIDLLGILDAARSLSSYTNLDLLRAQVVDTLSRMTGATTVHVLLWNDDDERWYLPPHDGGDGRGVPIDDPEVRSVLPLSAVRYAERTRQPLLVKDATRDDRFARDPYLAGLDACSLLVVPVLHRGAPQALLVLENRLIRGAFSAERLDVVKLITGQLAVAFDNALVYESLERKVAERTEALNVANERLARLSVTDPLTQLANRRRLEEVLRVEWGSAARAGRPIGVAMIDIDYFKPYNDHYGHPAGDECLQQVAGALRQHLRDTDLAARYGGEEFAIVMPRVEARAADRLAERLRDAVAALRRPHAVAPAGIVTVSVGVVTMVPTVRMPAEHIIELADEQLYQAKRDGRNRVKAGRPEQTA
jgi:diguanylate cyclase (GGDEF)-like protein